MTSNIVRDEVAFQQAWERISERYHGEKLTPAKGKVVLEIYRALDESVEKRIISKEDACKAAEIAFVVAHRESDLNPEAKNPKSSATGVFQQMETFPQRNKIDNWSVRKQPLTVEQRKDVFVSAGAFFKQLASTPSWQAMKLVDVSYEVQKYWLGDKHRYDVPYVHRIANCLATATYPDQQSILDNGKYNPDEIAERRCDSPKLNTCGK